MYSMNEVRVVDYNNLYTLFTCQYFKLPNSTYLIYNEYVSLVVSFTDYVRFVIDTMHSSTDYDISFVTQDKRLYTAARNIEPVLTVLSKITQNIRGTSYSEKVRHTIQEYLDNLRTNIGYDFIYLYESYLTTIALLQVNYCRAILRKNYDLKQAVRPFKILTSLGSGLEDFLEDGDENNDIQFITEIKLIDNKDLNNRDYNLDNLLIGDYLKDEHSDAPVLEEINRNLVTATVQYKNSISEILDNAYRLLDTASQVKNDRVIYIPKHFN
ncbi:hypothetical protein [Clostridium tertium]|uniref:hypothetical protein n=1 Tax=Clostridium tertium TaxID=1559 RepID=UPI0023B2E5E3|nr:hypothetical protein [Clostridium tertium]